MTRTGGGISPNFDTNEFYPADLSHSDSGDPKIFSCKRIARICGEHGKI